MRALAGDRPWITEVSGGLDSAIVAGVLTADQRRNVAAWVNAAHLTELATREQPRWFLVDVAFERKLGRTIALEEIKQHADALGEGWLAGLALITALLAAVRRRARA